MAPLERGSRAADGTVSVLAPPESTAPPTTPRNAPAFTAPPRSPTTDPPKPPVTPAAGLVSRLLETPISGAGSGPAVDALPPRPLPLLEALERSGDRTRRLWITQAYWKLAAASARCRFAAESEERLGLIAPGGNAEDLAILELATAAARGEAAAAGVELVGAQQELIDLVRLPVNEPPPWPADLPLTAAYQTHFETIFAARTATGRVRAIHRQLPLEHQALTARAAAVAAAETRFAAMEALHAKGSKPIGAVLTSHEALVEQEEAFVRAFRGYNLDIAEYVMAVADLSVPDEQFATMLIGRPLPWRQPLASAVPPAADRVIPVAGQSPQFAPPRTPVSAPSGVPLQGTPGTLPPFPGNGLLPPPAASAPFP